MLSICFVILKGASSSTLTLNLDEVFHECIKHSGKLQSHFRLYVTDGDTVDKQISWTFSV